MRMFRDTTEIRTEENQQFADVTKHVRDVVVCRESRTARS
jgi:hypothetical protein